MEVEKLVHIFKMLIALFPTEMDASQNSAKPDLSEAFVEQLTARGKAYYASEAEDRPPAAPAIHPAYLVPALFHSLTSASTLVGLQQRLRHHQQLGLLQELVKKFKAAAQQVSIQWNREEFLNWIVSALKVYGTSSLLERRGADIEWHLKTEDKQTLLQIAEIAADLEANRSLRPALQIAKTTLPKDIQMTVSREKTVAKRQL